MKSMQTLALTGLLVVSTLSSPLSLAAAPAAGAPAAGAPAATAPAPGVITVGHVRAVTDLLAAMRMEKMMRTITGSSRYASDAQRSAAYAKLEKVPPEQIYARLAYPLARSISVDTATEMARFYSSSYGQKVVYQMYNSKTSYAGAAGPAAPAATPAERKDMQRPGFIKASRALAEADPIIRHEGFVLLQAIAK